MRTQRVVTAFTLALAVALGASQARAADEDTSKLIHEANETLTAFKAKDPSLSQFLERSVGYAVFPHIEKVAVGVGGAHGTGVLFDKAGRPIGKTTLNQASVGVQLGGQSYAEVIFFETPERMREFQSKNFALSGQASAVALKTGAAGAAAFQNGVAVFTATKQGLMFEASVAGQRFDYEPFAKRR
jgi:lipid-binding SYLF domain-containing protein